MQHLRAQALPLFALAVETVDVEHHRLAEEPRNVGERAVGHVAQQHDVVVAEGDMHGSEERADPGVEVLLMQAGHDYPAHAAVVDVVGADEGPAAVHRDLVSVVGKARADLLGKALEAAIAIGDAASTDDGDFHEGRFSRFAIGS